MSISLMLMLLWHGQSSPCASESDVMPMLDLPSMNLHQQLQYQEDHLRMILAQTVLR